MEETTKSVLFDFVKPLLLLAIFTALFRFSDLDIIILKQFFTEGQGWVYGKSAFWEWIYSYAVLPGLLLGTVALIVMIASFSEKLQLARYRRQSIFLVLLLLLGPGLVVNAIFKDHWGRPRPRVCKVFSGTHDFLPVWTKGTSKNHKSFPSGHASIGFYVISPYFVLRRTSKKKAKSILAVGMGFGTVVGFGRMVQGGHFPSDIIWSAGFVYLCGLVLSYTLRLDEQLKN